MYNFYCPKSTMSDSELEQFAAKNLAEFKQLNKKVKLDVLFDNIVIFASGISVGMFLLRILI